jgi:hypothetical protein
MVVWREVSARPTADSGSDGAFLGSDTDAMFVASSSLEASLASVLSASCSPSSTSRENPELPKRIFSGEEHELGKSRAQALSSAKSAVYPRPGPASAAHAPPAPDTPRIHLEFDDDDALFEVERTCHPGMLSLRSKGRGLARTMRRARASLGRVLCL